MSLVERALQKMQFTAAAAAAAGQREVAAAPAAAAAAATTTASAIPAVPEIARKTIHLDRSALRTAGLLPPEHQERQIAEQYRQIKRPLVTIVQKPDAGIATDARLIMVTSAMPADGKTFTAINLALSMAKERDFDVLLVDADVAKPHISRLFGVEGEAGLLDTLRDPAIDPETLVMPTDAPGLSVMSSGRRSDAATELLASQRTQAVFRALLARNPSRIVLLDAPPLLLSNESRVLASAVGQAVVVVRAGKTSQQDLQAALGFLDSGKQAIGLVLNQSMDPSTRHGYYGYGDHEADAQAS